VYSGFSRGGSVNVVDLGSAASGPDVLGHLIERS
jgi:hypothetical protein